MNKHTPGPWFAKFEAGRYVISSQGAFGPHRSLAITGGFEPANGANARLIAAAPDLLAALNRANRLLAELTHTSWIVGADAASIDINQRIRATHHLACDAIKKAEEA